MALEPIVLDLETFAIDDAAQYLEPVSAPDNYKRPEAIANYIAEAAHKQLDRCALDPDLARIVALGWMYASDEQPVIMTANSVSEERDLLDMFWRSARPGTPLVSFNGLQFDLPMLMRRSQYLHVAHQTLNVDRYRTPHIDLMAKLTYNGVLKAHSLKFYLSRFAIRHDDLTTGKDIAGLVEAGKWTEIVEHCKADVLGTRDLARRLGLLPATRPEPVAVATGPF